MIPDWANNYTGIDFIEHGRTPVGCDCWGLVKLILEEQFQIRGLPDFSGDYIHTRESGKISQICANEARNWLPIDMGYERAGDVILLRIKGLPTHVGLVVDDGWMLHSEHGKNAVLEDYRRPHWIHRIERFYRHA